MTLEETHFFKPPERPGEGAVGRQQASFVLVAESLSDLITVKLVDSPAQQIRRCGTNREFEGDETTRLSTHGESISRYMLICPGGIFNFK